jgi:hypothetical protein
LGRRIGGNIMYGNNGSIGGEQGRDSSAIRQQKVENRGNGAKALAIGIVLLMIAFILVAVIHTAFIWLFIVAAASIVGGIVSLASRPSEYHVNSKREEAEKLRREGDIEGAERLKREAAALHEALKSDKNG